MKKHRKPCEEEVIEKIRERRKAGFKKYKVTVERGDLSLLEWLNHGQEEALDLAIYLQKLKRLLVSHATDRYTFVDNKGREVVLSGDVTLGELSEMGITVAMSKPESPLEDGWYRENGTKSEEGAK